MRTHDIGGLERVLHVSLHGQVVEEGHQELALLPNLNCCCERPTPCRGGCTPRKPIAEGMDASVYAYKYVVHITYYSPLRGGCIVATSPS